MTDVRPPTQSSIGKRLSQPSASAVLSSLEPTPVTATAWGANSSPFFLKKSWATSMPLRVSGVPPDLEMTTTSVSSSGRDSSTLYMPSGSVLSRKNMSSPAAGMASATSSGPRAEPPMPMTRAAEYCSARGGVILPSRTSRPKALTSARGPSMAAFSSGVGASAELRSQ